MTQITDGETTNEVLRVSLKGGGNLNPHLVIADSRRVRIASPADIRPAALLGHPLPGRPRLCRIPTDQPLKRLRR
jgi:hypothetical protein